jgi:hypothetical protein
MSRRYFCLDGRLMRHDPQPDDPEMAITFDHKTDDCDLAHLGTNAWIPWPSEPEERK